MSILDDFDKIVANQTQDPEYQKRLEMARWLEKYPSDWMGISNWFVRRAIAYNNFDLLPIRDDKIYFGMIPNDIAGVYIGGVYGTALNREELMEKPYFVIVRDSETKEVKKMSLTPREYNEFVRLKHYGVYEFTR